MAKGRGGGRGPLSREVQVSKKISWLLRHGAEKEGLQLGPGGYINVKDVVGDLRYFISFSPISFPTLNLAKLSGTCLTSLRNLANPHSSRIATFAPSRSPLTKFAP